MYSEKDIGFAPYVHEAYYVISYAKPYAPTFHGMPGHKKQEICQLLN